MKILRFTHVGFGIMFIALGVFTIAKPSVFSHYGIRIDTPEARIAIRAIVGGGEVGIGLFLSIGGWLNIRSSVLNGLATTILLSVGLTRLIAAWLETSQPVSIQPYREGLIEVSLGVFALVMSIVCREGPTS